MAEPITLCKTYGFDKLADILTAQGVVDAADIPFIETAGLTITPDEQDFLAWLAKSPDAKAVFQSRFQPAAGQPPPKVSTGAVPAPDIPASPQGATLATPASSATSTAKPPLTVNATASATGATTVVTQPAPAENVVPNPATTESTQSQYKSSLDPDDLGRPLADLLADFNLNEPTILQMLTTAGVIEASDLEFCGADVAQDIAGHFSSPFARDTFRKLVAAVETKDFESVLVEGVPVVYKKKPDSDAASSAAGRAGAVITMIPRAYLATTAIVQLFAMITQILKTVELVLFAKLRDEDALVQVGHTLECTFGDAACTVETIVVEDQPSTPVSYVLAPLPYECVPEVVQNSVKQVNPSLTDCHYYADLHCAVVTVTKAFPSQSLFINGTEVAVTQDPLCPILVALPQHSVADVGPLKSVPGFEFVETVGATGCLAKIRANVHDCGMAITYGFVPLQNKDEAPAFVWAQAFFLSVHETTLSSEQLRSELLQTLQVHANEHNRLWVYRTANDKYYVLVVGSQVLAAKVKPSGNLYDEHQLPNAGVCRVYSGDRELDSVILSASQLSATATAPVTVDDIASGGPTANSNVAANTTSSSVSPKHAQPSTTPAAVSVAHVVAEAVSSANLNNLNTLNSLNKPQAPLPQPTNVVVVNATKVVTPVTPANATPAAPPSTGGLAVGRSAQGLASQGNIQESRPTAPTPGMPPTSAAAATTTTTCSPSPIQSPTQTATATQQPPLKIPPPVARKPQLPPQQQQQPQQQHQQQQVGVAPAQVAPQAQGGFARKNDWSYQEGPFQRPLPESVMDIIDQQFQRFSAQSDPKLASLEVDVPKKGMTRVDLAANRLFFPGSVNGLALKSSPRPSATATAPRPTTVLPPATAVARTPTTPHMGLPGMPVTTLTSGGALPAATRVLPQQPLQPQPQPQQPLHPHQAPQQPLQQPQQPPQLPLQQPQQPPQQPQQQPPEQPRRLPPGARALPGLGAFPFARPSGN